MLYLCSISFGLVGQAPRAAVMRSSTPMMQATAEAASPVKMDLVEPVFPQVCEYAGVTLSRYTLEMARANPDKPELNEL